MKHGFFDRYSRIDSPAHRMDPRAKVISLLAFVLAVVSTPPQHILAFLVFGGLLSWACALARVPILHVLLRALGVLPFSILASVWMPFLQAGPSLPVLGGRVHLSISGLWVFAGVLMKSFLGASAVIWLVSTTRFSALLRALREMAVPIIIVDLLALTYRYLFVLVGEAMRLRRAAAARGYRPRWLGQALLIGGLIGRLFVRSYERAERVYDAMILRGFTGRMPASSPLRFRLVDAASLVVLIPTLVAVRVCLR